MKKKPVNHLLVICEDVRSEVDNKFTLVGVSAHPLKLKKHEGKRYATHTIAAYGEFAEIKHPEKIEIKVTSPDGNVIADGIAPVPEKSASTVIIAGRFIGLRFEESGIHTFAMTIDEHKFSREFEVNLID